jgi:hypothetical protein
MDVESTILSLLSYSHSIGFIDEKEFERFIFDLTSKMIISKSIPESFYPFYVFSSARRFFFFLDPGHSHKLNIKSLAHSSIMEEFLLVKRYNSYNTTLRIVLL